MREVIEAKIRIIYKIFLIKKWFSVRKPKFNWKSFSKNKLFKHGLLHKFQTDINYRKMILVMNNYYKQSIPITKNFWLFFTWLPKRLNPLIASRAAFAKPTELKERKKNTSLLWNIRLQNKNHYVIKIHK